MIKFYFYILFFTFFNVNLIAQSAEVPAPIIKPAFSDLDSYLTENIEKLESVSIDKLLDQRYQKLMNFGQYKEG